MSYLNQCILPLFCVLLLKFSITCGQQTGPIAIVNVEYNQPDTGFEILNMESKDVVIVSENAHNRIDMPRTTLKLLQHLHKVNNTRVLVIEAGASTAWLINRFLNSLDTLLLRDIARHTFYWGVEHSELWRELARWNEQLSEDESVKVVGADIEIKQESVVLALNILMQQKAIAESMSGLKTFRDVFKERSAHRNQFDALNVNYYYDKGRCKTAANQTLKDITDRPGEYESVFSSELPFVTTMLRDLLSQYNYDYNDRKFIWRDKVIYQRLLDIHASGVTKFVYVVGEKHTYKGSSSHRLGHEETSPLNGKVVLIKSTGRKSNGTFQEAGELTKLSLLFPEKFCMGCHVIIHNDSSSKLLTPLYAFNRIFSQMLNNHFIDLPHIFIEVVNVNR